MSPNSTPFHQLLERERLKRGLSIRHIAKSARASEADYKLWASGAEYPTRDQLFGMFGQGTPLVFQLPRESVPKSGPGSITPPALPKAEPGSLGAVDHARASTSTTMVSSGGSARAAAPSATVPVSVSVVPATPAMPWHEDLRARRLESGFSTRDLGEMIGVSASTVDNWECGARTPIMAHVEKIRSLGPPFAGLIVSESRDITKPGPARGTTGLLHAAPPAVFAASIDPLAAIDRILMSFDSLGQSVSLAAPERTPEGQWVFRLVTAGADDAPLAIGAGSSMPAAALDMIGSLRASFAARKEGTERIVRDATARLDAQTKALEAIDGALGIGVSR